MEGKIIRRRFSFSGAVQGVGFRWRARHAAERYGATGWVRNERDGSVTMELQGSEETIERVLDAIERHECAIAERRDGRARLFHTRRLVN